MLWLYLHFPQLLLDHLRAGTDHHDAMVVAEPGSQRITQACPRARSQGVVPGMRLKTAISLTPELTIVDTDQNQESRVLEQQARWLYRHAARIALYPPEGLLVEVSELLRLYGSLSAFWQSLTTELARRQLHARLAAGTTARAARLCARAGTGERTASPERLNQLVAALPLSQAEFAPRTRQRLERLGLTHLGEVFQLPPKELARRLAPETLAHVRRIRGQVPDPQVFWQPPHHFRQQADFSQDIERCQGLLFPLQRMLTELEQDLQFRQQDTDCLVLTLAHHRQADTTVTIRTTGPEHRAPAFLDLARIRLEQHALAAPVCRLVLAVSRFLPRHGAATEDLLGTVSNPDEAWHTLISRLRARLGDQALKHLSPRADHRPERAWDAADATGKAPGAGSGTRALATPQRPLWLLASPRALTRPPAAWLAGPERISGGWWDGQRVQRDYYIASLHSGQLAWVFRDVRDGWFIHGWFG